MYHGPFSDPGPASRGPKTAFPPLRIGQFLDLIEVHRRHRHDHQLGDAVTAFDPDPLCAEVDQDHADLASISRVDETGGIHD